MFILDTLLVGSLRFVLDKLAAAVDRELNDDEALRAPLLAAQMRVARGEMSPPDIQRVGEEILARLREIRERRQGTAPTTFSPADYKVTGVDATFEGEEHH